MSWKEKLKANPSKAELDVLVGLHERGLHPIRDHVIVLEATVPDYYFPSKRLPIYLDGEEVHSKERQRLKDELIDEKLRKKGLHPLRIPYKPPLGKKKLNEVLNQIEEALK